MILSACASPGETPEAVPGATIEAEPSLEPSPTPTPTIEPSTSLDGIEVTGKAGEEPQIRFESPMAIDVTRSQVLVQGDGPVITENSIVELHYRGVLGRTGEEFDSTYAEGRPAVFPVGRTVRGFAMGLVGKHVGDRVLLAIPGEDAYDDAVATGVGPSWARVGDTLVFVVDIIAASFAEPTGKQVSPEFKEVAVSGGAKPEVTIPKDSKPPADLVVQTVIKGEGRKVTEKDVVVTHYRTWLWRTGELLEDRFSTNQTGRLTDTLEAWKKGLPGQTAGSRVLLVAPSADTYPFGNPKLKVEPGTPRLRDRRPVCQPSHGLTPAGASLAL